MAMPGYFIEVTFTDGSVVTTYATVIGEWYYFYSDKRYRFTRGTGTSVILQQYQPIGTNMAWYDINIIKSVYVQQFDPTTAGGGAAPEDVYTKEEVNTLIQNAVTEIMDNINEIVNEAVISALGENYYTKQECDDRFVHVAGDTMTGQLVINYGNSKAYYGSSGFDAYTDNSLRVRIYDDGNGGSVACYQDDGTNVTIRPNNVSGYVKSSNAYKTITFAASGLHMNDTIIVPENSSFLVSGRCRYAGTYINSYYATRFAIEFNDKTYIRLINNNGSGAVACYGDDGNNMWLETTQLSAWVNGGTVQRKMIFEQASINFNSTVQVPETESFLVSGQCRYSGGGINRYFNLFSLYFNDTESMRFSGGTNYTSTMSFINGQGESAVDYSATGITTRSRYTIGTRDNNLLITGKNLSINADDISIIGKYNSMLASGDYNSQINISDTISISPKNGKGNIIIYDHLSAEYNSYWQFLELSKYIKALTSASNDPSTDVMLYAPLVVTMGAINSVINAIQDHIGTNYSASIPQVYMTGGGHTRGGGCGRGY